MKSSLLGAFLCFCLLSFLQPLRGDEQQAPPQLQPAQQQPVGQQAPPPPQTAQQPTAGQQPAQQQVAQQKPPQPQTGEAPAEFTIAAFTLLSFGQPGLRRGAAETVSPSTFDFPGRSNPSWGAEMTFPAGRGNILRFSYFRVQGVGDSVASENITLFGTLYQQGSYLSSRYRVQNAKISFDYLSYPFPTHGAKLRLKTLWEVQYTDAGTRIHAPFNPVEDSQGNFLPTLAMGTGSFFYPTFGLGVDYIISPRLRLEARGSGFGIPHHSAIWDASGNAVFRKQSYELLIGAKGFYYKTSPHGEEIASGTFLSAFVGLRWCLR